MLLLLDRGFFSYELWQQLNSTGVKLLARVVKNLILRPIRTLADGSYLAKVYKSPYDRQKDRDGTLGPGDPLHAGRSPTGRSRRGSCSDYESL